MAMTKPVPAKPAANGRMQSKIVPRETMSVQDKITALLRELNAGMIEKDEENALMLTTVFSRSSMLMVGPPGAAKSFGLEKFIKQIKDGEKFTWLIGKFTEPGEIFGPVDIPAIKLGQHKIRTEGKLPRAHIAFLDEFNRKV
jgi:MoxR-like ATPase